MDGREVFVNRSWVIIEYLPNIIITVATLNVNQFRHFLISDCSVFTPLQRTNLSKSGSR